MKFGTIIADPPWNYNRTSGDPRLSGYSDEHYEPLTTEDLCALPISDIAADGAVLLLWTTWPFVPDALRVVEAWGFEYVTGLPFVKVNDAGAPTYGVGYWFRGCTEPILLAKKKGGPSHRGPYLGLLAPETGGLVATNLKHSRKPESLHSVVEDVGYPEPRLELFARRSRPGWICRGNECPGDGRDIRESLRDLAIL